MTTGLANELAFCLDGLADGLAISNLGLADLAVHFEFAEHAVNDDLQVKLAHAGDDALASLLVGVDPESRILFSQLLESNAHLLLVVLGSRLNRNGDNRIREDHGLEDDLLVLIAEGITSGGILEAHSSSDIAAVNPIDFLTVVGVHLEDTADTLFLALSGVEHIRAGLKHTGVHTEECQLADVRIGHNLECQRGERLLIAGRTVVLLASVGIHALDGRNVRRSGHVVNHSIQQGLNALVAIGSAADHRHHVAGNGSLADDLLDILFGDILTAEVLLHEFVILLGASLQQFLAIFFSHVLHVIRNGNLIRDFAEIVFINDGFHLHEVDDALEIILSTDGQLDSYCIGIEALLHHLDDVEEVRTGNVHLVDISHARNLILLSLAPNGLSLRLNTTAGSQDCHSAVKHAQGTLNLYREVHVARRINDVDTMVLPVAGGSCGSNGDTALLLLNHPVHGSSAIMNLTDLVVYTRVEEDTLRGGRLTGVDVSHDTDITSFFKGKLSCHFLFLSLYNRNGLTDYQR